MFVIDGPMWFVGALLICGVHMLYLRSWRRERRIHLAWWQTYDADSQKRHDAFMRAIDRDDDRRTLGWNLSSSSGKRGQA